MVVAALVSSGQPLDVSSTHTPDEISLIWLEQGGPAIPTAPDRAGFGGERVDRGLARQRGGAVVF